MIEKHLDIVTADGAMNSFVVHPVGMQPSPVILFLLQVVAVTAISLALLLVALPAHAFVVGFARSQPADGRKVDTALVRRALDRCAPELKELERDVALLERVVAPFPRIDYTDAVATLQKKGSSATIVAVTRIA